MLIILDFIKYGYKKLKDGNLLIVVLWILIPLFGLFVSLNFISKTGAFIGISRYLFAFPLCLAYINYINSLRDWKFSTIISIVFFGLGALTLPLQFVVGEITWFPESSERAGSVRYSSMIGSLTSLGTMVGVYILLANIIRNPWYKSVIILILVLCSLISLSKAAIANVCIAIVVTAILNIKRGVYLFAMLATLITSFYILYSKIEDFSRRVQSVMVSFGLQMDSHHIINYDVSFEQSILERITTLPLNNYLQLSNLHTSLVYITGGGFGMASTALVPEDDSLAIMSHNQYVENITVFGWFFGTLVSSLMLVIAVLLGRKYVTLGGREYLIMSLSYICYLVNAIFANGVTYQPIAVSVVYMAISLVILRRT